MARVNQITPYCMWCLLALVAGMPSSTRTLAQESPSANPPQPTGRIEFDFAGAPPAKVEIDLQPELIGLGETMIASVVDAVANALQQNAEVSRKFELTDERMTALRHVVSSAQGMVHELHVRIYETDETVSAQIAHHFSNKIVESNWDNLLTVRDDDQSVKVAVLRHEDAIRGVFVIVSDGDDVVLLNAACELSPEKVKSLVSIGLQVGMELGLDEVIGKVLEKVSKEIAQELH
jgi:hypothetical protein